MKLFSILLLCAFSTIAQAQDVEKYRATSIWITTEENKTPKESPCDFLIVMEPKRFTVHTEKKPMNYDVVKYLGKKEEEDGSEKHEFSCVDDNGQTCIVTVFISPKGKAAYIISVGYIGVKLLLFEIEKI